MDLRSLKFSFIVIESIAFGLNLLVLYLIYKIVIKNIDIWLGIGMAICDLLLSSFMLFQILVLLSYDEGSLVYSLIVNPLTNGLVIFITMCSITIVGYLGITRWLVICRGYQPNRLRYVTVVCFIHMMIFMIVIILSSQNGGFIKSKKGKFYHPDYRITNLWGFITSILLIINLIICFLVFNSSYISIARHYLNQLNIVISRRHWIRKQDKQKEKLTVALKIALIISLYNFIVIPPLIVTSYEIVTQTSRSYLAHKLSSSSIIFITIVNPVVLVTMHCETRREFRRLLTKWRGASIRNQNTTTTPTQLSDLNWPYSR